MGFSRSPISFYGSDHLKKRPGLIFSPDTYNKGADSVFSFITSKIDRDKRLGDYLIEEWKLAQLPKPSLLRMEFATIEKSIIIKKIGKLSELDRSVFRQKLLKFFDD